MNTKGCRTRRHRRQEEQERQSKEEQKRQQRTMSVGLTNASAKARASSPRPQAMPRRVSFANTVAEVVILNDEAKVHPPPLQYKFCSCDDMIRSQYRERPRMHYTCRKCLTRIQDVCGRSRPICPHCTASQTHRDHDLPLFGPGVGPTDGCAKASVGQGRALEIEDIDKDGRWVRNWSHKCYDGSTKQCKKGEVLIISVESWREALDNFENDWHARGGQCRCAPASYKCSNRIQQAESAKSHVTSVLQVLDTQQHSLYKAEVSKHQNAPHIAGLVAAAGPGMTVELIGLSGSLGMVLLQCAEPCEGLRRLRFAGARCLVCLPQDIVLFWGEAELTDERLMSMLTTSLVAPTVTVIVRNDLRLLRLGWVGWHDAMDFMPPLVGSSSSD